MESPTYAERIRQVLEDIRPGLPADMGLIVDLSPESAQEVVSYLLSLACEAQHIRNITLGREYLARMPRDWLVTRIEQWAEFVLAANDDWQYRRLLELYALLDGALTRRLVERGKFSAIEEIRATALAWAD